MSAKQQGKRTLWLLIGVFAVPFIAAYIVLNQGWYQTGVTNQGELLENYSYQGFSQPNPDEGKWQLISYLPESCDNECQLNLIKIRQSWHALGGERERVSPVVFSIMISEPDILDELVKHKFLLEPSTLATRQMLGKISMVIVDPQGTWVMAYPKVTGQQAHSDQGKAILRDLKKLLKLSRIG